MLAESNKPQPKQEEALRGKIAAMREGLRLKSLEISDLKERVLALQRAIENQDAALEEKNVQLEEKDIQIEELAEHSRILKQGLDAIEGYFSELRASRSFQFMVYTSRRLGLVSRTPRRCVEAIKNHFPVIRKALKQVKKKAPRETIPESPRDPVALRKAACRRHAVLLSSEDLTVGFAVTEATPSTAAGDFFTASELAEACVKEFGWTIRYLSSDKDWYDLKDIDVLVVLLDNYELSKIRDAKPALVKVAWLRNWFERWVSRPDFEQYDLFLSSSIKSARWLKEKYRKPAWVFPLATNPDRFAEAIADPVLESDYCFTGSYWEFDREIVDAVRPAQLDYKFAIFGKGWKTHPTMSPYAWGFLPYADMPKVYASTQIVVDDANHVTKDWGSVNSRVFDALAAGALVITNGGSGAREVFDGDLPVYRSSDELQSLLTRYLEDKAQSRALVDRLRRRVLSHHTYRHRARKLKRILIAHARRAYRIAFKIGAPTRQEIQHWGDYHFARSLGRYLAEEGHSFRIDCLDEWDRTESLGDDVVIVLRGLSPYEPKPGQINLMWNISHPDKIEDEEFNQFDHVFVASEIHSRNLGRRIQAPVAALLQCTDPDLFFPDPNPEVPAEKILFVGNSRKHYREAVRFAIEAEMPIAVYGTHWPAFIPQESIRGEYIDNARLRQHYSRCDILLNDHWPSMKENGFASNRIFDAAAAGAFVLSDAVEGSDELFGGELITYKNETEFGEQVRHHLAHPDERRARAERLRARVLGAHTFAHRAASVLAKIEELDKRKRGPADLSVKPLESAFANPERPL